jgi:hypothetical protein
MSSSSCVRGNAQLRNTALVSLPTGQVARLWLGSRHTVQRRALLGSGKRAGTGRRPDPPATGDWAAAAASGSPGPSCGACGSALVVPMGGGLAHRVAQVFSCCGIRGSAEHLRHSLFSEHARALTWYRRRVDRNDSDVDRLRAPWPFGHRCALLNVWHSCGGPRPAFRCRRRGRGARLLRHLIRHSGGRRSRQRKAAGAQAAASCARRSR